MSNLEGSVKTSEKRLHLIQVTEDDWKCSGGQCVGPWVTGREWTEPGGTKAT